MTRINKLGQPISPKVSNYQNLGYRYDTVTPSTGSGRNTARGRHTD